MTGDPSPRSTPTLSGNTVELRPLHEGHRQALLDAASDGELWNFKLTIVPGPETIDAYLARALDGQRAGTVMPFVTVRRADDRIVGTTRFWKVDYANRKLEIGSTWLAVSAQRSAINTEAKYLMLKYAFETLRFVRVQFTTDESNEKSRAAILRLGAKQEGLVRNERIMPDGRKRNSYRFSIIEDEWPAVRSGLEAKLRERA